MFTGTLSAQPEFSESVEKERQDRRIAEGNIRRQVLFHPRSSFWGRPASMLRQNRHPIRLKLIVHPDIRLGSLFSRSYHKGNGYIVGKVPLALNPRESWQHTILLACRASAWTAWPRVKFGGTALLQNPEETKESWVGHQTAPGAGTPGLVDHGMKASKYKCLQTSKVILSGGVVVRLAQDMSINAAAFSTYCIWLRHRLPAHSKRRFPRSPSNNFFRMQKIGLEANSEPVIGFWVIKPVALRFEESTGMGCLLLLFGAAR
ncbi:hypothetical protein FA15DRAFT_658109 [Coprinopsis marcescibilis]|uniref:Uncharacterized protein n=1 Tax=Coprinopsis marcescibilis TaxID=230819 RepID=A0A5C3KN71_COPMA|nr:hypothetical protein FA15DRAFT_658109 [Coprinopsis marcescibilis]